MFKNYVVDVITFFVNLVTSIAIYLMAYHYLDTAPNSYYWSPISFLFFLWPLFLPVFIFLFIPVLLLWGFQLYLAKCYRRKNYAFLYIVLPALLALQILASNKPDTLYPLAFNSAALAMLVSLALVMLRSYFSEGSPSNEKPELIQAKSKLSKRH